MSCSYQTQDKAWKSLLLSWFSLSLCHCPSLSFSNCSMIWTIYISPPSPPPIYKYKGDGCIGTTPSVILSVCPVMSACYLLNCSTKCGMVVYYHKSVFHAEKLVHYHQCHGHSKGLYNQNITIFTLSSKLLVCFATKLSLIVQHHKLECPVEKKWMTVFEAKVTAKVQNVSECLSGYLLNHRTFCYQTWYGNAASGPECHAEKLVHCV